MNLKTEAAEVATLKQEEGQKVHCHGVLDQIVLHTNCT